jgi:hypothetical protein
MTIEVQFQTDTFVYTRLVSGTALLQLQQTEFAHWQMLLVLPSRSHDVPAGTW